MCIITNDDTDLYDYSFQSLTAYVIIQVKPRPIEMKRTMPESLVYDGYEIIGEPSITNVLSGDVVNLQTEGELRPITAGTYTVHVVSIVNKNYTLEGGTNLQKQFTIAAKTLDADNITAIADLIYAKKEIKSVIEVKDRDTILTLCTDYKAAYENNINTGTAKVNVEFIGNYQGIAVKEFTMLPKTIDKEIPLSAPVKKTAPQTEVINNGVCYLSRLHSSFLIAYTTVVSPSESIYSSIFFIPFEIAVATDGMFFHIHSISLFVSSVI